MRRPASLLDHAFALLQSLLPQRALARGAHALAEVRTPWLKDAIIRAFAGAFAVDLADAAVGNLRDYPTFGAFFTRALAPGARPLPADPAALACPVDGTVSELGTLAGAALMQAKGRQYSVEELLGADRVLAERFRDGAFATLYLAPCNYHRIHMPLAGSLRQMTYLPGRLYSVNARTARAVDRLFARNERVVCLFETAAGPLALVLVGALMVGSMETVWHGPVRAPRLQRWDYDGSLQLERGAELGRFNMGSTVIALFARDRVAWSADLRPGTTVRMGQLLGIPSAAHPPPRAAQ